MRKTRNVGNVAGGLATVVVVLILGLLLTLTVDRSMGGDVLESNKNNSEPEQEYETQQHNSPISPENNLGPEIAQILANKTNAEKIAHDIDMELIRLGYNKQLRLMIELYRKYNLIIDRICDSKESNTSQSETFQAELRSHYARVQKFFNDNEEFKLNLERDNIDLNSVESGLAEKSETATRDTKKLLAKIKSLLTNPFRKIFKKDKLKPETPVPEEPQSKQFEWQKDMTDKEMNKISALFSAAYNNKWKLGFLGFFLAGVGYLAWRGPLNDTEVTVKTAKELLTTQNPILSLFNNPTTASLLAAFLLIILAILAYIHFCDKRRSNRSTFSKQDSKKIEKKVAEKNNNNNKNSVFKSDSSKKKTLKKEARKKNKPSKREQSTIVVEPSSSSSSSLSRRSSMLPSPPDSKKAKSYRGSKLSTISMSSKSTPIFSKFTSNLRSAKQ